MLPGPHADLLRKMPWLSPTKTRYDRVRLLEAAGRARTRGRRRKAAALYAEVLRVEPENDVLRRRIALLLAQSIGATCNWNPSGADDDAAKQWSTRFSDNSIAFLGKEDFNRVTALFMGLVKQAVRGPVSEMLGNHWRWK